MKTLVSGLSLSLFALVGCGGGSPNDTDTATGTSTGTDGPATVASTPPSTTDTGVSDSDSTPTTSPGSMSESQTDTGDTTATTSPATLTGTDTTAGPDPSVGDTSSSTDTSISESSTSTSDSSTSTSDSSSTGSESTTTTGDESTSTGEESTTGEEIQCGLSLQVTIRDFKVEHPDFEDLCCAQNNGMVATMLGPDGKPVWDGPDSQYTTADNFNQWYNDVPNVNQKTTINIDLVQVNNVYSYTNNAFFPIDNMLWGNEGNGHNYHFTTEIHSKFQYNGGETFTFSGDDDVWVFINKQLVIDIGGVHGPVQKSVMVDTLGLNLGSMYTLDVFHAERHTVDSNFRIDTTICSVPQ